MAVKEFLSISCSATDDPKARRFAVTESLEMLEFAIGR